MNSLTLMRALTETPDTPTIDPSDLTPGALEKLLETLAPSLQKLVFNVVISLIIFFVGRKLIDFLLKLLDKFLAKTSIDVGVSKFLVSAARTCMYAILIFMIVGQLGVNTASIVTVMGAAGLAISMSLQGSLANVAGVQAIGLVYTTITTVDNRVLTIPNGTLANSAVTDASMMPERRLDISVGISYDSDIRKAKEIMEEVYRSCPAVIVDKGINVHVSSLGDSAVVIEAFGWVPGSEFLSSKWYVTEEIKLRFDEGGIKIPYPQMDVHLDTVPK